MAPSSRGLVFAFAFPPFPSFRLASLLSRFRLFHSTASTTPSFRPFHPQQSASIDTGAPPRHPAFVSRPRNSQNGRSFDRPRLTGDPAQYHQLYHFFRHVRDLVVSPSLDSGRLPPDSRPLAFEYNIDITRLPRHSQAAKKTVRRHHSRCRPFQMPSFGACLPFPLPSSLGPVNSTHTTIPCHASLATSSR